MAQQQYRQKYTKNKNPDEIKFECNPCWKVYDIKDFSLIFKYLPEICPTDSIMHIETSKHGKKILGQKLEKYIIHKPTTEVKAGTKWPKFYSFHLTFSKNLCNDLFSISESHAAPEYCDHLTIYQNKKVTLSGYDFSFDPIFISNSIPEDKVKRFCTYVGCKYKESRNFE